MIDSHSLEGADLDIGGEYHKLIYDQVLTAQAKKIGKKYGAKVEENVVYTEISPSDLKRNKPYDWDALAESFGGIEELRTEVLKAGSGEKIWSLPLTDKLKQASKDGMPYYVALPPLVMGAAAQRSDAQRQQSKSDAQAILAN